MFDVGLWEVGLLLIVGLLVLGPERLPRVARMAGAYLGKARRTWIDLKSEIDRELTLKDLERAEADVQEQALAKQRKNTKQEDDPERA